MTVSLVPRKLRAIDGNLSDADQVEVAQDGLGLGVGEPAEMWVTALRQQGAAARELAQHAIDIVEADGTAAWADADATDLAAGYGLRFLPAGDDPAANPPVETNGRIAAAGNWNIYATVPSGVPSSRVRVQVRAGSTVVAVYPDATVSWGASSHVSHDAVDGYRLTRGSGQLTVERVTLAAGQVLYLQVGPAEKSDTIAGIETDITALADRVTTNELDIADLESDVGPIHNEIDAQVLDALPDPDGYEEGEIVVVGDRRYKLAVTASVDPLAAGVMATTRVQTGDNEFEQWIGLSQRDVVVAPGGVGAWDTNPGNIYEFIGASIPADADLEPPIITRVTLQVAIDAESLWTAAGGTDETGLPGSIGFIISWADNSDNFTLHKSTITFHKNSRLKIVYQGSTLGEVSGTHHFPSRVADAEADFTTFDPDTLSAYFVHTTSQKHWIEFFDARENETYRTGQHNAGRLDRLEGQVEQLQSHPTISPLAGEHTVQVLDRLPHPTEALPARAVVRIDSGAERSRLVYISKAGGAEWNDWTIRHEYDASVGNSLQINPAGAVLVNGEISASTRTLVVDGAGTADLREGLAFTIGSDSTVHWISQLSADKLTITTYDEISSAANDAVLNFASVPVGAVVDAENKNLTVQFGDGTFPVRVWATYIEGASDFPTEDWAVDPYHYADTEVETNSSLVAQTAMSQYGLDAPTADDEYVRIESLAHWPHDGEDGYPAPTLPGLYRRVDYPAGLAANRWRVAMETTGDGYTGVWVPGDYSPSAGPPRNFGAVVFDPTAAGLAGLYVRLEGDLWDYRLVVDEAMYYGAMYDRVRYLWATGANHRTRGDEPLDGVTPVETNPHHFGGIVDGAIHNNLVLTFHGPDGAAIGSGLAFNVTGRKSVVGGRTYRFFESLTGTNLFAAMAALDYVDVQAVLDADHAFPVVRDWFWPMKQDDWGDTVGLRQTGTPGAAARTKAWQAIDVWHPTVTEINRELHAIDSKFGGYRIAYLANQAAYDALTPSNGTIYFVDGASQGDRRIYIGNKRWE